MNDSTAPNPSARREIILTATDFSPASDYALWEAWRRTAGRDDAELHVVYVVDEPAKGHPLADKIEARRQKLDELHGEVYNHVLRQVQSAQLAPLMHPMTIHIRFGEPVDAILHLAANVDADLLVVGSHGKSGFKHHFGSISRKLLEAARLPMLVSRPKQLEDMRDEVQLDPPCPDCVATRQRTGGTQWWCDVHGREHIDVHGSASTRREHVSFTKGSADADAAYSPM